MKNYSFDVHGIAGELELMKVRENLKNISKGKIMPYTIAQQVKLNIFDQLNHAQDQQLDAIY